MKLNLKEGIKGELEMTTSEKDSAANFGSDIQEVLGTPVLIGFMETTAKESMLKYLPEGYTTIGTEINVRHIKAVTLGKKIRCNSELVKVKGKDLFFEINVWCENNLVVTGTIQQYAVKSERFLRIIQRF